MTIVNNQFCPVPGPASKRLQRKYESYAVAAAQMPPATTQPDCNNGKYAVDSTPEAKLQISAYSMKPAHHSGKSSYKNRSAAEFHTECFKIDRKKLEQMMTAESTIAAMNEAEYFLKA
ncbi:Protein bicaudal C [Eumeta japonica]|uniref:Protein bicaudal C n=1 Tax=Eumeta variegata TaxID=151549 RepID=A0A4C1TBW4_EUMVA|nr:Protein bicaudal C [Eumeta japonica]